MEGVARRRCAGKGHWVRRNIAFREECRSRRARFALRIGMLFVTFGVAAYVIIHGAAH